MLAMESLGRVDFYSVLTGMSSWQCAGTLSDFLFSEVLKLYPKLRQYAEVVLVQSADHILPVFDGALQKQAEKNLEQLEVRILTGVRVRSLFFIHFPVRTLDNSSPDMLSPKVQCLHGPAKPSVTSFCGCGEHFQA
jgi:hypothetical protein